jgi:hypothetical protein
MTSKISEGKWGLGTFKHFRYSCSPANNSCEITESERALEYTKLNFLIAQKRRLKHRFRKKAAQVLPRVRSCQPPGITGKYIRQ